MQLWNQASISAFILHFCFFFFPLDHVDRVLSVRLAGRMWTFFLVQKKRGHFCSILHLCLGRMASSCSLERQEAAPESTEVRADGLLGEHLSAKPRVSMTSGAVGPLGFLDFSPFPSPSTCADWLKLRCSVFSRGGRVVPGWMQLKRSCWWCTWTTADGGQAHRNACQGKRCWNPSLRC